MILKCPENECLPSHFIHHRSTQKKNIYPKNPHEGEKKTVRHDVDVDDIDVAVIDFLPSLPPSGQKR